MDHEKSQKIEIDFWWGLKIEESVKKEEEIGYEVTEKKKKKMYEVQ